ncbi:MAG: hypothetical protein CM15mP62_28540 [Rhodospirillaceae bacterium]|nr:MAG: hypothetical protein CM15mP62_28540 [Rhodospirillaceae bacterium]
MPGPPATQIKLIFANSQMKLVTQLKMRARIQADLHCSR